MIAEAKKQAEHIIEAAIIQANIKKEEIIMDGNRELEQNRLKVMQELKEKLAQLIIIGAQQIIEQHLDQTQHQRILLELSNKLYGTP